MNDELPLAMDRYGPNGCGCHGAARRCPRALRQETGGRRATIDIDGELAATDEPGVFAHYTLPYATGTRWERRLARR
jgi:hypothetical protein